ERGHMSYECQKKLDKCLRCGRMGHKTEACRGKLTCYNCGEDGHKNIECKKPKKVVGRCLHYVERMRIRRTILL
ncbi:cellular nucleic acid-binding protein, partial [Trifolium medium]|nr:cellular nucleic acid-binding protein [Trifolium medium]